MMTFVVSYVKEKSLSLQKDVMKHISAIPIEGGDSQKPMHFVQLSSLLDQLAQADKATHKSVLATNFKTLFELKEHLAKKPKNSAPPPPATVKEEKAPTPKPTGDSQVANAIRGFATMAGNNPEMMVNMILMGMSNYQLAAPETITMMRTYSKGLAKMEGFTAFVQYAAEMLATMAESEEGEELIKIMPLFMQEDTRDKGFEQLTVSVPFCRSSTYLLQNLQNMHCML